jgi:colanic acid/amylovoran biosynthesis glycosyltransferase
MFPFPSKLDAPDFAASIPFSRGAHSYVLNHFSGYPITSNTPGRESNGEPRVAYYLSRFPALSETFIQREVSALKSAGLTLQVFADAPDELQFLDENARSFIQDTHFLLPEDLKLSAKYRRRFFRNDPVRYLNIFLYTVLHRYGANKNMQEDARIFHKAVYLAGLLRDGNINHIHSPWANVSAFIALVAARLAGMSYSVQARASADLYRTGSRFALTEKFENAKFIVTNCRFNQAFVQLYINPGTRVPIHVIYEGLDLQQFTPTNREWNSATRVRILSVARLIEEKGLVYLLQALKVLKDGGFSIQCEIIGAPVEPMYASYYTELKELERKLELQDSLAFLGALPFDQVLRKYKDADIFVLPCVVAKNGGRDVTPNALIEAMAMKLPVISTRMAGIPEIVEDGVSGLLIPPKNARALAQALMKLIREPAVRKSLGENARRRVEERFDISKNASQYLHLFAK